MVQKIAKSKDWKQWKVKGWEYKEDAPYDEQYIKDRDSLFRKNGNGWWYFTPNKIHKFKNMRKNRIRKRSSDEEIY